MRTHWLRLRATAHATEDLDKVLDAVHRLTGLDADDFAKRVEVTDMQSHHGAMVHLIEVQITNQRPIRAVLAQILPDRTALLPELEARTDDDGVFYLRFDKQQALAGEVVATRGEDAIQVRWKPEVHPSRRENAIAALREWLSA